MTDFFTAFNLALVISTTVGILFNLMTYGPEITFEIFKDIYSLKETKTIIEKLGTIASFYYLVAIAYIFYVLAL